MRFEHTGHYTDEDWAAVKTSRDNAYNAAIGVGRGSIWNEVLGVLHGLKSGEYWSARQLESFLGLLVYGLVGTSFQQERLDELLGSYHRLWAQVGDLFELTLPNSPERQIAVYLYTSSTDSEETIATVTQRGPTDWCSFTSLIVAELTPRANTPWQYAPI